MSFTGQNPRFRSTILTDIGVASIANPASGSHRIINRGGTLQVQDDTGLETAIGAGGTVDKVTQTAHGFSVGEILYYTGTAYARGLANAANTSEIVGMVSRVIDANIFEITLEGKVTGLTGLTAGEAYFLSPTVSGAITATEPTVLGHVSLPIGVAISATVIYVRSSRGAVVGSSNARTEIALANNAVTNVQSVAAYQAGELTGWVEIDGTTDLKFYVAAPFAKNGAGSDYNISPQYVGDTPPVGFSMSVTSGGIIQATLPSIAGYVSAKINFALNAPAVGATFPLTVDSTAVQFSTLKAKDSGGFVFQENGGTQIGSWSDSGAIDIGPTSGTLVHKLRAGNTDVQIIGSSAGSNQVLDFIANGVSTFNIASGPGIGSTWFRTNNSALVAGQVSTLGGWIFGASGGVEIHQFHGALQFGTGSSTPTPTYGLRRNGSNALEFFTNSTSGGTINSSGGWVIGPTATPNTNDHQVYGLLRVDGNNGAATNGQLRVYRTSSTATDYAFNCASNVGGSNTVIFRVECDGDVVSATNSYTSDERAKKDITPIQYGLNEIIQLNPISFRWNHEDENETKSFSIATAQEVQAIMPEMVRDDGLECMNSEGKSFQAKSLYSGEVMAVMVKAIQELSAKVTALENKGV